MRLVDAEKVKVKRATTKCNVRSRCILVGLRHVPLLRAATTVELSDSNKT